MFISGFNKPIKTINQAPCLSCGMNFNNRGLACYEFCDRVQAWLAIQSQKITHITRQEVAGVKAKGGTPRAQPPISRGEFENKVINSMREVLEDHEDRRRREKEIEAILEEASKEINEFQEFVNDLSIHGDYSDEEIEAMADEILDSLEEKDED